MTWRKGMPDVMRWKNAAVLALAVMAVGCSSNSKKELPPNELPDIQEEVRLDAQWSRSIGDGQGELYNLLTPAVDGERLGQCVVDGLLRMQRTVGVLEDHLHGPVEDLVADLGQLHLRQ